MNLIELVRDAMADDDEDSDKQSDYLAAAFNEASPEAREALDRAFIALCGYSLTTLIERTKP